MSDTYAKVFKTMFTGSMYGAGLHVFATWAWVLTHKDERGLVEVNTRLVAAELGAEVEQIERAIEYLTAPDPGSRSPEEQGRRMVRVSQFGYQVVNHARYASRGRDRTAYWREYRAKRHATVAQQCAQVAQREITHVDVDVNVNADTPSAAQRSVRKPFVAPTVDEVQVYIEANPELANVDAGAFVRFFEDGDPPWTDSRGKPVKNWKQKLRTWSSHNEHGATRPQFDRNHEDRHSDFGDTITV
jgi:hypothetical protein